MFRQMRRSKQQLSESECAQILTRATSGVLALSGDGGYPYAVPLSFAYDDGRILFHCAATGHKLDALAHSDKASFCVVDRDTVAPEAYTSLYRSVIAFGRVRVLSDDAEKHAAIARIAGKYFPLDADGHQKEIDRAFSRLCLLELTVEHMTGKQAAELQRP